MARTPVNPRVLTTPSPVGLALRNMLAANSKTWKNGQIGILSSGTVLPNSTATASGAYCIMAADQDTSTSASMVDVRLLEDGTELEIYCYATSEVSAIATASVGTRYGIITASNITYLDLDTANGQFEVIELASSYMPERSSYDGSFDGTTGTTAGLCKVKFRKNVS